MAKYYAKVYGLVIKRSPSRRLGLFAARDIPKGLELPVWGTYRTSNPKDLSAPLGVFTLEFAKELASVDESETQAAFLFVAETCPAGFINDPWGPNRKAKDEEGAQVSCFFLPRVASSLCECVQEPNVEAIESNGELPMCHPFYLLIQKRPVKQGEELLLNYVDVV